MEGKQELIFGTRAVIEAIEAGKSIQKLFIQKGGNNPLIKELQKVVKEHDLFAQYVPVEKINKLSSENHQGVVAVLAPIEFHDIEDLIIDLREKGKTDLKFVMLDRITDVRNFGAIARSAECFGIDGIIIQEQESAPINGTSIKTSAGALMNIPVCRVKNVVDTAMLLKSYQVKTVGASEKSAEILHEAKIDGDWCLVMGSEENGIQPKLIKMLDEVFAINMSGKVASLNVSVATGIFLDRLVNH